MLKRVQAIHRSKNCYNSLNFGWFASVGRAILMQYHETMEVHSRFSDYRLLWCVTIQPFHGLCPIAWICPNFSKRLRTSIL
ncbi:hypothetical protein B0H11DRAFT_2046948, partial [Mycena galericulata]